jgi:hypothetical protein
MDEATYARIVGRLAAYGFDAAHLERSARRR